jgi:hypothetical protein
VDLEAEEVDPQLDVRKELPIERPYRLSIGAGPFGKDARQVRVAIFSCLSLFNTGVSVSCTMDKL